MLSVNFVRKIKLIAQNIFLINFISLFLLSNLLKVKAENSTDLEKNIDSSYLLPPKKNDYILDTGDVIKIKFLYAPKLNGKFLINQDGEIYLPKVNYAFVRGLTIFELEELLEQRYKDILINPDIEIRIDEYKPVRVFVKGEIRSPGVYKLEMFSSVSKNVIFDKEFPTLNESKVESNSLTGIDIKGSDEYNLKLSNALFKAGGLTQFSDIKNIEIIRDIPLGLGGGKKKAIVDLTSFLNKYDPSANIKIFDGDTIYIPRLEKPNSDLVAKSVLTRLTPKFLKIDVYGRIENTGTKKIPIDGTLSDVMDIYGPLKPLSGKVVLIRFKKDGSLLRKKINYSRSAQRGSTRNPYLMNDDIITVQDSIFGKSTKFIQEATAPFLGIYATKELIDGFSE